LHLLFRYLKQLTLILAIIMGIIVFALVTSSVFRKPVVKPNFTADEIEYIREHPVLKFGMLEDHPPIVFMQGDSPSGASYDYLKIVEEASGIKFNLTMRGKVPELIEAIKTCQVQVLPGFRATGERISYMGFSQPYLTVATVMILLKETNDLSANPKIGIAKGYAAINSVSDNQNYNLVQLPGNKQVMEALLRGEVEGAVMNLASANYHIAENKAEDMVKLRSIPWLHYFSMGLCKKDFILTSIIDKSLSTATAEKKREIETAWKISN
jgi:polar amino acid transport system substrate-binding protein